MATNLKSFTNNVIADNKFDSYVYGDIRYYYKLVPKKLPNDPPSRCLERRAPKLVGKWAGLIVDFWVDRACPPDWTAADLLQAGQDCIDFLVAHEWATADRELNSSGTRLKQLEESPELVIRIRPGATPTPVPAPPAPVAAPTMMRGTTHGGPPSEMRRCYLCDGNSAGLVCLVCARTLRAVE